MSFLFIQDKILTDESLSFFKKLLFDGNILNKIKKKKIRKNDNEIILNYVLILHHISKRTNNNFILEILNDYLIVLLEIIDKFSLPGSH